jgi:hypothetical protein
MKRIFLITATFMMMATSKNAGAQWNNDVAPNHSSPTGNHKAKSPDKKKFKARSATVHGNVLKDFMRSNRILSETKAINVNINAVRHFIRSYGDISDAKWFATECGYIANFLSKGIYTKIAYDEKGRWLYNLLEYTEANLAFEIRHRVKRNYYDDDIFVVHQYEFDNNKTVYLIRMRDQQSNIVTLKVCDGEIEDITPFDKK